MIRFTTDLTSDLSQNPVLLYMLTGKQNGTTQASSIDQYLETLWPTELFPKIEIDKKNYGPSAYINSLSFSNELQKENEWFELVGIDFYSLPEEKRNFLLKTAGIFEFKEKIDIKKVYETSIY